MLRRLLISFLPAVALSVTAARARAVDACGGITLPEGASCEVVQGSRCMPRCGSAGYERACAPLLYEGCAGTGAGGTGGTGGEAACALDIDPACVPPREADCLSACAPETFDCVGYCRVACLAGCAASRCAGDPSAPTCVACEATCRGACEDVCAGAPADCAGQCTAAAQGSCISGGYHDCQAACQQGGFEGCAEALRGSCADACAGAGDSEASGRALFCGGDYVDGRPDVQACIDHLASEGVQITLVTDPALCEGPSCGPQDEASSPSACSAGSAGRRAPAAALLALLPLALWLRRRALALAPRARRR